MVEGQVDAQQIVRSRLPAGGLLAREIMTSPPVTIGQNSSVFELAGLLSKHHNSAALVVDDDGELLGVASVADVLNRAGDRVCDVMTTKVAHVSEDTPVDEIAGILARHQVKRVPVLQGKQPVGIVSRADIVRAIGQLGQSEK
jgi:CBS domain-containing protein